MSNTPTIETERLILRRFTPNDCDALLGLLSDKELNNFLPWYPVRSKEECHKFYEEHFAKKYQGRDTGYYYAICLKEEENKAPIGYINLEGAEPYDLGYALCKEYWHQGIVTEAGRALIAKARSDRIPYITATHDRNNPRSGAVMQRLGMRYCYTYVEQWQPKNIEVHFRLYQLNLSTAPEFTSMLYWDKYPRHYVETNVVSQH